MPAQRLTSSYTDHVSCSELGALFECDPRLTLRGLYLRKTSEQPERVAPGYMLAGRWYEPAIRQWYLDRHPGYAWDAQHADYTTAPLRKGNLSGHPDGIVTTPNGARWIAEAKLALMPGQRWYGVPLWYQWQVQGYMALTGLQAAVVVQCVELEERNGVVVAIDCREWLIEADRRVQAAILWEARRFIREHVRTGRPPAAVPRDLDDLKREEPATPAAKQMTKTAEVTALLWQKKRAEQAAHEAKARALAKEAALDEAWLVQEMDGCEAGVLPDGTLLRRKRQDRKGFTVAPSTTWKLTIERTQK